MIEGWSEPKTGKSHSASLGPTPVTPSPLSGTLGSTPNRKFESEGPDDHSAPTPYLYWESTTYPDLAQKGPRPLPYYRAHALTFRVVTVTRRTLTKKITPPPPGPFPPTTPVLGSRGRPPPPPRLRPSKTWTWDRSGHSKPWILTFVIMVQDNTRSRSR